jgi:hypothetical protein
MDTKENTTPASINLDSLIAKDNLEAVVEFRNGLKFKVRFVTKVALNNLAKSCTTYKWDQRAKSRVPQLSVDAFVEQFCALAVKDWEGATLKVLQTLAPISTKGMSEEQVNSSLPFSQANLVTLMKNSTDLDEFLQNVCTDINVFGISLIDEIKN